MTSRLRIVKLTEPEIFHILACLDDREHEGCYYGPREQFWKRHARIIEKLDPKNPASADKEAADEDS